MSKDLIIEFYINFIDNKFIAGNLNRMIFIHHFVIFWIDSRIGDKVSNDRIGLIFSYLSNRC